MPIPRFDPNFTRKSYEPQARNQNGRTLTNAEENTQEITKDHRTLVTTQRTGIPQTLQPQRYNLTIRGASPYTGDIPCEPIRGEAHTECTPEIPRSSITEKDRQYCLFHDRKSVQVETKNPRAGVHLTRISPNYIT